jgi:hypothetical protein
MEMAAEIHQRKRLVFNQPDLMFREVSATIVSSLTARQQTIAARFHKKERIASNSAPGLAFADGSHPGSSQQDQHHLVVANHRRNQNLSHLHELATF